MGGPSLAAAFAPVDQHYLLEARQMQALSFSVHIVLVCFGISFPAMVLFVEWLGQRTRDRLYLTLARRWSKVMLVLFGVGVITGTVFFMEAIFIGIYVYGWGRLSARVHMLSGIPIVITGFTGSLMVIAVNAWMNHPGGFQLRGGHVTHVDPFKALFGNTYLWHELMHMYVAGYVVSGFILAGCYAYSRLRGRWGRYERVALTIPLTVAALATWRARSRSSWRRWRACIRPRRALPSTSSAGTPATTSSTRSRSPTCSRS